MEQQGAREIPGAECPSIRVRCTHALYNTLPGEYHLHGAVVFGQSAETTFELELPFAYGLVTPVWNENRAWRNSRHKQRQL